jgi:hypothetical protein
MSTTADRHNRTLRAKEREFEAFLDLLVKTYPYVIMLLRQQRDGKRTTSTGTSTNNSLHASRDQSDGECHDGDDYGDDHDDDNVHGAGRVLIEVAKVRALIDAMSQRLSLARGDIQRYVEEVQHDEGKYCELGSRLFRAASDASDAILVDALFGLIPLLLGRVGSPKIADGEDGLVYGVVPGEGRKPSVFPAAATWPPTVPPTVLNADICESSLGFYSSILPFWSGGRWQVAVFRSTGTRVLIDPWGLDGSRDPHVRRTS